MNGRLPNEKNIAGKCPVKQKNRQKPRPFPIPSSNETVASVSQDGRVRALSAGTANISATSGGLSAGCMVTVREEMPAPDFCVTTTGGTAGSNFNTQNYTKWSKPVKSCLFVDEDGYLTRAEFINGRLIRDIQHGRDLKRQRQYPGRTSTDGRVLCVRFLPVYCLREDEQQGNNASGTCHHWRKNVQSIRHWQSGF